MGKFIIGIIVIVALAVGGYYAYMQYGGTVAENSPEVSAGDAVVQAQEITAGTGEEAVPGSVVSVLYVGRLADGTVFDSSEAHGNEPLVFQLGTPGIIAGFQIGVNGMREGGERLIAIPPAYGYGSEDITDESGAVLIPANSTLVFEVQLIDVQPAPLEAPEQAPTTTEESATTE